MNVHSQSIRLFVLLSFIAGCGSATPSGTHSAPTTPISPPTIAPSLEVTRKDFLQLGNWHEMIFHEGLGQIILINGGPENGKRAEDPVELWAWDGIQWSLLSADTNGPRWRNFASTTYDSNRDVLVLYGGITAKEEFQDTWEWDGNQWTQISAQGPGLREGAGMAYDAKRKRVVLFGGAQSGTMMNDLWEWDGDQWSQISTEGPSPRFPAGFVYDVANEYFLLFGGHSFANQEFATYGDTWIWNGMTWKQITVAGPSPRDGARAIYIPIFRHVFLFGGAEITTNVKNLNDSWIWNGTKWQELELEDPRARVHPAMAFDVKRGVVVMTGGSNGPNSILSDTWEWDGQTWRCKYDCK